MKIDRLLQNTFAQTHDFRPFFMNVYEIHAESRSYRSWLRMLVHFSENTRRGSGTGSNSNGRAEAATRSQLRPRVGRFAVWSMPDKFLRELVARVRPLATQP